MFIIYCWGGGQKFCDLLSGGGGANFFLAYFFGGAIFFNALFCKLFLQTFFRESDIACITTVVGARQQHKGMFLKQDGEGGGAKIFQQCHGGGAIFPAHSRGRGVFFRLSILPNPPPPPGHK